ncbi:hypothetical protein J6590_097595 [Homalodisca vitripennis]|nr:hypothetical protein J6590_097595 [Homalodisca vitripennis]
MGSLLKHSLFQFDGLETLIQLWSWLGWFLLIYWPSRDRPSFGRLASGVERMPWLLPEEDDDVHHTFLACGRFTEARRTLVTTVGDVSADTIVELMLQRPKTHGLDKMSSERVPAWVLRGP